MSIFDNTNNPGNLTAPNGGIFYPGQTGAYTSPNGITYAKFGNVSSGMNALTDYVSRHIPKWSDAGSFAVGYLGTSVPNNENVNPSGYTNILSKFWNGGDVKSIAQGIATAEGNGSKINDWLNAIGEAFGNGDVLPQGIDASDAILAVVNPTAEAAKLGLKAVGDATGINKLIEWLKDFFSVNTAARFAAVIIGIIFITVALVSFILSTDTGKAVVKGAATAAV